MGEKSVNLRRVLILVAVVIVLGAALSVAAAGAESDVNTDGPVADGVVVDLDGEGDAVVTVAVPFDLNVESERSDFEAFVESEAEQQAQLDQYESRLANVAAEMESRTGREMAVRETSIATQTRNDRALGLVVLTATWEGLAANDGSQLVLGPPFDSGFNADRTVVVRPPEQYQVVSAAPDPTTKGEQLRWNGDQSLDGFEVVVESQADTTGGTDDEDDGSPETGDGQSSTDGGDSSGPGFEILAALLGIAAVCVVALRR